MSQIAKKRITVVGDQFCGKTCLSVCASEDLFLEYHHLSDYVQDFSADVPCGTGRCSITILDTTDDAPSRSLAYTCCDAVVVCFDLTDSSSLESVESKWLPELEENCPGVPFILAGCKRDAMCDSNGPEGCVCGGACCDLNEEELVAILSRTGAHAYIDCSALTGENVGEVFSLALRLATPRRRNSAKKLFDSIKSKSKLLKKRLSISLF